MGIENIVELFFKTEGGKIKGSCNIECKNAAIYKKFLNKVEEMHGHYVTFTLHPRSMDGSSKPSHKELIKLGFGNINTAIADTIDILNITKTNGQSKKDTTKLVDLAIGQKLRGHQK